MSSGVSTSLLVFVGGFIVLLVLLPEYAYFVLRAFACLVMLAAAAFTADRLREVLSSDNDYQGQRFSLIVMGIVTTIAFLVCAYNAARRRR